MRLLLALRLHALRQTVRSFRRGRGSVAAALVTLAIGLSAATLMFSVVSTVLLRPLPFGEPDRIALIWGRIPALPGFDFYPVSGIAFRAIHDGASAGFSSLEAFRAEVYNVATHEGHLERLDGLETTATLFDTLRVVPAAGRFFRSGEDAPGAAKVAVIGYGVWGRLFGFDPSIVGASVTIDGRACTIVGVAPPGFDFPRGGEMPGNFQFPARTEIWIAGVPPQRGPAEHGMVGRLAAGVTLPQAQSTLDAVTRSLETQYPGARGWMGVQAVPLAVQTVPAHTRTLVRLLFAAAIVLVLIACANAAQILVVRGVTRRTELAVRVALGATRTTLVLEALLESLLLSLAAAACAIGVSVEGIRVIRAFGPSRFPRLAELSLDWRVAAFAVGVAGLVGLATSLWPIVAFTRPSTEPLLRGQVRGGTGRGRRVRQAVLALQVAASLLLLVAGGLLVRSVVRKVNVDPGFKADGALTFEMTLPPDLYPEQQRGPVPAIRPKIVAAIDRVLAGLRADPRVEYAAIGKPLPFSGAQETTVYVPEGVTLPSVDGVRPMTEYIEASDGLVRTLGERLLYGRDFTPADREASQPVIMVTKAFGRFVWHQDNVVGRRVKLGGSPASPGPWMTIVGVVDDIQRYDLGEQPLPTMFVPYTQGPYAALGTVPFVVKPRNGDPFSLIEAVRAAVRRVDPLVPVANVEPMTDILARATADARFAALLMGAFTVAALFLALAGLYGTVAFAVTTRTPELGLRMALGATRPSVVRIVMLEGFAPAVGGLAAGLAAAWISMRLLSSLLFGVTAHDAGTFLVAPLAVLAVALVACAVPALRAARIDPREAMAM